MNQKFGKIRLHHAGIAVRSIADSSALFKKSFGFGPSTEIIEDKTQKVRVGFSEVSEGVFVEFVEPAGSDTPVSNLLKRGGGIYHLCYRVPNIENAIKQVRQAGGILVSGPVPAEAFGGRKIAFVYTADRNLAEFVEDDDTAGTLLEK